MGACTSSEGDNPTGLDSFQGCKPSEDMFEVMTVLGIGSFGTVSCCRRKGTSTFLALKCIKKARLFRRTDHSALVWNERDAMIKCCSPFLVPLLCSFHNATELFLAMPFYIGGDLSHRVRTQGPLRPSQVRFFLAEMLSGVEAMHDLNVCHRDIKPDNVLLDAAGHIALTDLGLAVEYRPDDVRHSSRFWGQCGSYGYRAPEVVLDSVCGPYSDVYSLGITAYFLLYGAVPWPQTQCYVDGQPLIFPDDDEVPESLKDLIAQMLSLDVPTRIPVPEMREHPVYEDVKWDLVDRKSKRAGLGKPPIVPDSESFCFAVANPNSGGSPTKIFKPITAEQRLRFTGFEWVPGDPVTVFGNPFHWSVSPSTRQRDLHRTPRLPQQNKLEGSGERNSLSTADTGDVLLKQKEKDGSVTPRGSNSSIKLDRGDTESIPERHVRRAAKSGEEGTLQDSPVVRAAREQREQRMHQLPSVARSPEVSSYRMKLKLADERNLNLKIPGVKQRTAAQPSGLTMRRLLMKQDQKSNEGQ